MGEIYRLVDLYRLRRLPDCGQVNHARLEQQTGGKIMNSQETSQCRSLFIANGTFGRVWRQTSSFLLTVLLSLFVVLAWPADSFAQSALTDDADTRNGNTSNLTLSPDSNVYLKFKLSSTLPPNTAGASVRRAT